MKVQITADCKESNGLSGFYEAVMREARDRGFVGTIQLTVGSIDFKYTFEDERVHVREGGVDL